MRMFVTFLSWCALLAAQTPFTRCPAAMPNDGGAARAAAEASHLQHHGAVAATVPAGTADVTVPVPPQHNGPCTMLTRCDWVAVPTAPIGSELPRGFASESVPALARAPATVESLSSTPPPKTVS